MLKGIFVNWLKKEIHVELKLYAISTLEELMDKALLLEEKNKALRKAGLMRIERKMGEKPFIKHTKGFTRWKMGGSKKGASSKVNESEYVEKKVVRGGKLSHVELRERSRKGLCFKYGETWGKDHVCKLKHYQFLLREDSQVEETKLSEEEEEKVDPITIKTLQSSLKNDEGLTSNQYSKIMGRGMKVLVLVDCGASTNFISKKLVQHSKLEVIDTREFEVEVGIEDKVWNRGICKQLEVVIQGIPIVQQFFLME